MSKPKAPTRHDAQAMNASVVDATGTLRGAQGPLFGILKKSPGFIQGSASFGAVRCPLGPVVQMLRKTRRIGHMWFQASARNALFTIPTDP